MTSVSCFLTYFRVCDRHHVGFATASSTITVHTQRDRVRAVEEALVVVNPKIIQQSLGRVKTVFEALGNTWFGRRLSPCPLGRA